MAVAVLEHPDTDGKAVEQFFAGFDRPPVPTSFTNRPLDVKYLLDNLQQKAQENPAVFGQLNLQQVGVIANQGEYRPYLSESYLKSISTSPFNLSLVQSLTTETIARLKEGLATKPTKSTTSP